MRSVSLFACSLFAASLVAQSPLVTLTGGVNSGNSGGGIYFDLQVNSTITINQISALTGSPTAAIPASNTPVAGPSILEIWLGPTTYFNNATTPSLWTPVATATGNVAMTTMVPFTLTTPLCLGSGNYGVALKSLGTITGANQIWGFGYTNGTCTSTTPGACSNGLFTNTQLTLRGGAAQNAFLSATIPFQPRIFNGQIHYTPGGTPIAVAAWENYGTGCIRGRTSFEEFHPNSIGFDQTGTTLHLGFVGSSYNVNTSGTAFTAPSATASVAALGATGNEVILASTILGAPLPVAILYPAGGSVQIATDLQISTDGYVTPVPGNNPWSAPTVAGFLSGSPRWAPYWKNINPSSSGLGNITVEVDPANTLIVSWNGVADPNGTTTTSSFQIAFLLNGDVEYRYGPVMSTGGGGSFPVLVGWTPGGGALDNAIDVSAAAAGAGFSTNAVDNAELSLAMNARPRLGTTPNFVTTNCPPSTVFGISMLSFAQINPGASLAGYGAPNCFQYQGGEVVQIVFGVAGGQFVQAFPIPNAVAFNGTVVLAQSAALVPGSNLLGLVFSNGTRMLIGSL